MLGTYYVVADRTNARSTALQMLRQAQHDNLKVFPLAECRPRADILALPNRRHRVSEDAAI